VRVVVAAPVSSQGKYTPLHMAAAGGHAEVAKALLAAGANVHATEKVSEEYRWGMKLDYKDGVPYMRGVINEAGSHVSLPYKLTHPLRVRVLSGCSCLLGNDVICVLIPRPTPVVLLSFVFLSVRIAFAAPLSALSGQAHPTSRGGALWSCGGGEGPAGGRRERPRHGRCE